ncbi:hypothetical protein ColLi_13255 [Colletotrichum liriopes]|uniref:Uncharacterized protein n=1 Tax=Colletotrichum liriopes TaxID=708192 RepID=A0AA37LZC6_9PEZI|nr:hypothetical protein ColLi_13255 [Colletotrichum liriopes]
MPEPQESPWLTASDLRDAMTVGIYEHPLQGPYSPSPSPDSPKAQTSAAKSPATTPKAATTTLADDDQDETRALSPTARLSSATLRHARDRFSPGEYLDDVGIFYVAVRLKANKVNVTIVDPATYDTSRRFHIDSWFREKYGQSLRKYELLLVPVCLQSHWVLFTYSFDGCISYYDSLPEYNLKEAATKDFFRFLDTALGPETPRSDPVVVEHRYPHGRRSSAARRAPLEADELREYYKSFMDVV